MIRSRPLVTSLRQTGPIQTRRQRLRVSLLLLRDERVFLLRSRIAGRDIWFLPGGSVDWGETLAAATEREGREELGVEVEVGPLVAVLDSIAPSGDHHTVDLIFHVKTAAPPIAQGEDDDGNSDDQHATVGQWFSPSELPPLEAYPSGFLTTFLPAYIAGHAPLPVYRGNDWD